MLPHRYEITSTGFEKRKIDSGTSEPWVEGQEYVFAELFQAYVDWQKNVKSPVRPEPTASGKLGEMLMKARFVGPRKEKSNGKRYYALPSVEDCLQTLGVAISEDEK